MEPTAIPHLRVGGRLTGAEKDRAGEDPPETIGQAAIVRSVLRETPVMENLTGAFELHSLRLLPHGLSRDPQRDQAVLAEGHPVIGVAGDLQKEPSVPP